MQEILSIVIPVYRNEGNLRRLVHELERIGADCPVALEVVFVVDGSPDRSLDLLRQLLPRAAFSSVLVALTRNFGPFNAVRCGMERASGDYVAVLPADLQEPADLALTFLDLLRQNAADIVFGTPSRREDPWFGKVASRVYWAIYRRLVLRDLPPGGVHVFGCTRIVCNRLIELREPTVNLIALLFWLGFRRLYVPYDRQRRREGRSAWTFAKKLRYGVDSVFNFTDLPIRLLLLVGLVGTLSAMVFASLLLGTWLAEGIPVPGYAPTVLVITFFGSITSLGLGIIGQYVWLILQATRGRPDYLIEAIESFHSAVAIPRAERKA